MSSNRILVVEDDCSLSQEVAEMLQVQGFEVQFAKTVTQCEQKIRAANFSLYIIDLLLPDGHGHEVIRKIRKTSCAGVIVLSGRLDEMDKVVALELGADDYVVKPFARAEFVARVKSLFRRINDLQGQENLPKSEGSKHWFGDWTTDLAARKLFAPSGEEVHLTKLEFNLWVAFLNATDRVLTREDLIYAIKGREWSGYDRSIDGLVSRLRIKMSKHQTVDNCFETIRGVGYLLRSDGHERRPQEM